MLDENGRVEFDSQEDFEDANFFSVNTSDVPGSLTLNASGEEELFPFIWIANFGEGTISKFDVTTGDELGRYRTGPESIGGGLQPSRVAVDGQGNVWVANRAAGRQTSIVKVLNDGFIDRNGNGRLDTAVDTNADGQITLDEVLPWDANGDGLPDDERIVMSIDVGRDRNDPTQLRSNGLARAIAIDSNDNIWVGLYNFYQYEVYDSQTGELIDIVPTVGRPYGAAIDGDGNLWSAAISERFLERVEIDSLQAVERFNVGQTYGVTITPDGIIWGAGWTDRRIYRFDPATGETLYYGTPNGETQLRGIAVDQNGDVWASSSNSNRVIKFEFDEDGRTLLNRLTINVGSEPTAVVMDAEGFIWTTARGSDQAWKIDPDTDTVVEGWPVTTGDYPYNYSDMTGVIRLTVTERRGTWTEIMDGEAQGIAWGAAAARATLPDGSRLSLRVRASDDREQLEFLEWKSFANGAPLFGVTGRFLEVEFELTSADPNSNPSIDKIVVQRVNGPTIDVLNRENEASIVPGNINLEGQAVPFTAELLSEIVEEPTDLTRRTWNVTGVGNSGNIWDGSTIVFTSQTEDGSGGFDLAGYFDWISTNSSGVGRETFTGKLNGDGLLELYHEGLEPIPGLGGPNTDPSDYFARLSVDGTEFIDGTWVATGTSAIRGTWGAQISSIAATFDNPGSFPNQIVDVRINNQPTNVLDPTGRFFANVDVEPGWNEYLIEATDIFGVTGNRVLRLFGQTEVLGVESSQFVDISGSFTGVYGRTSFEEKSETLFVDLATRNDGVFATDVPLYVGVKNISYPMVEVIGNDGVTEDGVPYFDFSQFIDDGRLDPNELTDSPAISFFNPDRQKFDYELVFYTTPNNPPEIISLPQIEALIGRTYQYDVDAIDSDSDVLSYSLTVAPAGMEIDSETGLISWEPTEADIGNFDVAVQVADGRGGSAEQRFTVSVIEAPSNRPPVITSEPVTVATANTETSEQLETIDLGDWEVVQFDFDQQPPANWLLEADNTIARQTVNADASILLGDFDATNQRIEGKWKVDTNSDDDFMGFVFGYQDASHFYLFDWKQSNQTAYGEFAERGMSVKVVNSESEITESDLWATSGSEKVTTLFHDSENPIPWQNFAEYTFQLDFRPGRFQIRVFSDDTLLREISIDDSTFSGGQFGFYNFSQSNVVYEGFAQVTIGEIGYEYQVEAVDPDFDPLRFSLVSAPSGMTINDDTGRVLWAPTVDQIGNHDVTVRVEDGRGGVAEQSFIVAVKAPLPGTLEDVSESDLTIGDVNVDGLSFDQQLLTVDGEITATLANLGPNATSAAFEVAFFEDLDNDQLYTPDVDSLLGTTRVTQPLGANEQLEVAADLAGTVQFANTVVYAFVDSQNAIIETDETNNLAVKICEAVPTVGTFDPEIEWNRSQFTIRPSSNQVMMTPAVADINEDGIPDIVFSTFVGSGYRVNGTLRAISGSDGAEIWTIDNSAYEVSRRKQRCDRGYRPWMVCPKFLPSTKQTPSLRSNTTEPLNGNRLTPGATFIGVVQPLPTWTRMEFLKSLLELRFLTMKAIFCGKATRRGEQDVAMEALDRCRSFPTSILTETPKLWLVPLSIPMMDRCFGTHPFPTVSQLSEISMTMILQKFL